jgi:transposase
METREDLLQKLLADYAQILAGEQINSQVPRRWLLIDREVGMGMHPHRLPALSIP